MNNFDELEKQIDWIARELRNEVKSNNGDIDLKNQIIELADEINLYAMNEDSEACNHIVNYFIQSLKREFKSPEVIQREGKSSDYTW